MPSIHEIGRQFKDRLDQRGFRSSEGAGKKGYIRRVGKRAIEVVNALGKSVITATHEVPVLGRVPAGKPFHSEEKIEGMIAIPNDIGSGKQFALLVKGDSMIDAGIMDGDR